MVSTPTVFSSNGYDKCYVSCPIPLRYGHKIDNVRHFRSHPHFRVSKIQTVTFRCAKFDFFLDVNVNVCASVSYIGTGRIHWSNIKNVHVSSQIVLFVMQYSQFRFTLFPTSSACVFPILMNSLVFGLFVIFS